MNLEKEIFNIYLEDIVPNRFQPREAFDEASLEELANSIKEHGVIQPIIVRKLGDKFEIIAGERRYRASKLSGLQTIPAIVREAQDKEAASIALVENLQRKDLSAIEEARAYNTILSIEAITQEELAKTLGITQSTIANKIRLLNLFEPAQLAILNNEITERHARALLNIKDPNLQEQFVNRIKTNNLTVAQVETEIKNLNIKVAKVYEDKEPEEEVEVLDFDSVVTPIPIENKNNLYDIRFAVNNVRQAIQNTEKFGFKINTEETEDDSSYQIVIKIDK